MSDPSWIDCFVKCAAPLAPFSSFLETMFVANLAVGVWAKSISDMYNRWLGTLEYKIDEQIDDQKAHFFHDDTGEAESPSWKDTELESMKELEQTKKTRREGYRNTLAVLATVGRWTGIVVAGTIVCALWAIGHSDIRVPIYTMTAIILGPILLIVMGSAIVLAVGEFGLLRKSRMHKRDMRIVKKYLKGPSS